MLYRIFQETQGYPVDPHQVLVNDLLNLAIVVAILTIMGVRAALRR